MNTPSLRQPTAFLPVAMSLAALSVVLIHAAVYGTAHEADEGAAAHIFQLLIVAEVPLVAFFAIKWLPREPKQACAILAMQAAAVVAAMASVYFLT